MRLLSCGILAGGKSTRMGSDKADLIWNGERFLLHQIRKCRAAGCTDVIISGRTERVDGARSAADLLPNRGPLGGIYTCLSLAKHQNCLIMSVDTPLLPVWVLEALLEQHCREQKEITVLKCREKIEPLIGIYQTKLAETIYRLIRDRAVSVRELMREVGASYFEYQGDERLLINCNTRKDYDTLNDIYLAETPDKGKNAGAEENEFVGTDCRGGRDRLRRCGLPDQCQTEGNF